MTALPDAFLNVPLTHRALHEVADGRPENSPAAIRAAMAAGYGIEIDLQLSHDGRAMVFHDYDLTRLTGASGPIQQRSCEELSGITLTGNDEGIPNFREVLTLINGRVPLLVELKDQHGQMGDTDGRLEQAVADDLAGYTGPVAVMSFNPHSVIRLRALCPDVPRGLVTCGYPARDWPLLRDETRAHLRDIPDYGAAGACFISHELADLERDRVAQLKSQGAKVLCWTVRSPQDEARARRHADNITFERYLAAHA